MHTWYLLGIQLMLELKKNGSTLYLSDQMNTSGLPVRQHIEKRT
jgi:hypothetical protein